MRSVIILAFVADPFNSPLLQTFATTSVQAGARLICADSGGDTALAWGLIPDLLVGDMDSISPNALQTLSANPAVTVKTSPVEKDETDLELAILEAIALGTDELTIVGGVGGRLDHTLGNLYLLAMPQLTQAGIQARILAESEEIFVLRPSDSPLLLNGVTGEVVSLFPFNGEAGQVYTKNLYYPLNRETLFFGPSRGISNQMTEPQAEIGLESGLLLVIHQFSK